MNFIVRLLQKAYPIMNWNLIYQVDIDLFWMKWIDGNNETQYGEAVIRLNDRPFGIGTGGMGNEIGFIIFQDVMFGVARQPTHPPHILIGD